MNGLLEIYRANFKTWIALQLQYRAALVIWLLGMVLEPVIYLIVWSTVARSSGGQVGGYSAGDFAAYFLVLMLVNHATFTWIMWEYEYRIREGTLSPVLLRPIHPIHRDIAENLSYKLLTLSVMLPIAVGLGLYFQVALRPAPWAIAAFVPALVLAFALRFMIEWALAMAAFWTTRVSALNSLYYLVSLFLSGQMAPLSLLPPPIQTLATVLPFRWTVAFPVEVLLGRLTLRETLLGFAAQAVWLLLSLGVMTAVWRAGVRRYSAVGA